MSRLREVEPKYVQIANYLREQIRSHVLEPGQAVPSERQIVADWNVSRPTAARVLASLRADGLIVSRQGLGSIVTAEQPQPGSRQRQVLLRRAQPAVGASARAEILEAGLAIAPSGVCAVLGIMEDSQTFVRRRVSFNGSQPRSLSTTWVRVEVARAAPELFELTDLPLEIISYIEQATGLRARLYRERVHARLGTLQESHLFRISQPLAVLVAYHTVVDAYDRVLSYEESVYPQDRVRYEDEVILSIGR